MHGQLVLGNEMVIWRACVAALCTLYMSRGLYGGREGGGGGGKTNNKDPPPIADTKKRFVRMAYVFHF